MAQARNTQAPALKLAATPGQTIGPFYGYALPFTKDNELVNQARPGAVRLHGVVTDGAGTVIPDALLEIWQPDQDGNVVSQDGSLVRDGYTFTGWGRTAVDNVGHYTFTTLNPGATEEGKAPFIMLTVFARGLLNRLFTRIYLPEDTAALANDPLLSSLDEAQRKTLIATREADGSLRFDISLQGEDETVFLSYPRES
ncbi:protocatechuate 3,4-dioxygenase subunit alpha [Paeniglutamicibacter sp. ABSL32-1]|uniref:protocatechuate 3,4-dioxygenase subunit alpha n=1 Tax=Paeniglutamicibacter quisquiliarum TaxID=2849498 RepID=UPI001C2D07E4|nr:protocatechuate 3,4-dioxygenase subunit alpha [Paeniglutamicibacter quisquiliarum]MBV1777552.1 protocatechuate 3,4-dioxygenase subunit alpha [Paeniglutamicibacter quisquiliarum]